MVAELAQWPKHIKVKQLALRLRGPAQAYYQTCSETKKHDYTALVQAMSKRFIPVRIQALECSTFHERKQGKKESVDTYAQELQWLFQRAYPSAVRGNADAQEMGQAVLSSQFVGGLVPEIKRKIAYLEGATFSELWQKARFEEVCLRDLESTSGFPRKPYGMADRYRMENPLPRPNWNPNPGIVARPIPNSGLAGQPSRKEVLCFKCHQPGHIARNCRHGRLFGQGLSRTREPEALGRPPTTKTAAVTPANKGTQLAEEASEEPLTWLYGAQPAQEVENFPEPGSDSGQPPRLGSTPKLPVTIEGIEVEALVDTGCPTTVISKALCRKILDQQEEQDCHSTLETHRHRMARNLQLRKPSLQLQAYCGTQLLIGAEITLHLQTGDCQTKGVALVQEDTPVELLLGTNLMPQLGVQVLDSKGHSLLCLESTQEKILPSTEHLGSANVTDSLQPLPTEESNSSASLEHPLNPTKPEHSRKVPASCQLVSGSRRAPANPKAEGHLRAVVRLVRASKLPARSGKLLQAKARPVKSAYPQIFEPKRCLHDNTVDIASSILSPSSKGRLLLPVFNFAEAPTWLKRGQILGWIQPVNVMEIEQSPSITHATSPNNDTMEASFVEATKEQPNSGSNFECEQEVNNPETIQSQPATESPTPIIKAVITSDNPRDAHSHGHGHGRLEKLKADLQLDKAAISPEQVVTLETFLLDNADVFALDSSELGRTQVLQHSIDIGDHSPIYQPARRIPFALRNVVDDMVKDMMDEEIIQYSHSPWASPVVLVKKKDGSMRFCVDYRRLNSITKRDVHPLRRIDDTLDALAGAQYFTTLDLASGYWQVAMSPADKEKTAFVTHSGLYEFSVMPFGLCNAPATFQRLMERVLEGLARKQCLVYLDDTLVVSSTWEEHLQNLHLVFERLRKAGLCLKPKKCSFAQREVTYLGHVISKSGISVDSSKVEKIQNYPIPKSLKTLRQFLGIASYYRRFTPQFSKIAEPLYALIRKNTPFVWTSACEKAFERLKELLTSPPNTCIPKL